MVGFEDVFSNARRYFTLQFSLMLAPLQPGEPDVESRRKVRLVAAFLDILLARRLWATRSIDYSTLVYAMFLVIKEAHPGFRGVGNRLKINWLA